MHARQGESSVQGVGGDYLHRRAGAREAGEKMQPQQAPGAQVVGTHCLSQAPAEDPSCSSLCNQCTVRQYVSTEWPEDVAAIIEVHAVKSSSPSLTTICGEASCSQG